MIDFDDDKLYAGRPISLRNGGSKKRDRERGETRYPWSVKALLI